MNDIIIKKEASVKCVVCKRLHYTNKNSFVTIYGNITVGLHSGVVGDNLNEYNQVVNATIYCKTCFKNAVREWFPDPVVYRDSNER